MVKHLLDTQTGPAASPGETGKAMRAALRLLPVRGDNIESDGPRVSFHRLTGYDSTSAANMAGGDAN